MGILVGILVLVLLPRGVPCREDIKDFQEACPPRGRFLMLCNLVVAPSGDGWVRPSSWETPSAHLHDHQTTTRVVVEEAASHQEA